ncbi:MAG: CHAD domain-containing protein [Anaerolineae bacterium]|nr:CHAD domain-containing protein [Anaerolineae bacterium]
MPSNLTHHERAVLNHFSQHGSPAENRRARIVLMADDDAPTAAIAAAVSLSEGQVRYWRRTWDKDRLAIFPALPKGFSSVNDNAEAESVPAAGDDGTLAPEFGAVLDKLEEVRVRDTGQPEETGVKLAPAYIPGVDGPRMPLELNDTVGILPDDSMAEAGRKVLLYHFERMLLHEPGSRTGEDIESVHDMRVATRRMRSAFRLFRPAFKARAIQPHRDGLRQIAERLGEVRDLDVFMDKAWNYTQLDADTDLSPLIDDWGKRLGQARQSLVKHLDSRKFSRFVREFHLFLVTPDRGARVSGGRDGVSAYQLRHIAPRLIYEHYEQVRAYETVLDDPPITTLHALRIDFKRLRYTLEFFEDVLGPEARQVIKKVKTLQDHLGDLHDTDVAIGIICDFVDEHNRAYSGIPLFMRPDISGVLAYAAAKEDEKQHLLETFPPVWDGFLDESVRRDLALAVSIL